MYVCVSRGERAQLFTSTEISSLEIKYVSSQKCNAKEAEIEAFVIDDIFLPGGARCPCSLGEVQCGGLERYIFWGCRRSCHADCCEEEAD